MLVSPIFDTAFILSSRAAWAWNAAASTVDVTGSDLSSTDPSPLSMPQDDNLALRALQRVSPNLDAQAQASLRNVRCGAEKVVTLLRKVEATFQGPLPVDEQALGTHGIAPPSWRTLLTETFAPLKVAVDPRRLKALCAAGVDRAMCDAMGVTVEPPPPPSWFVRAYRWCADLLRGCLDRLARFFGYAPAGPRVDAGRAGACWFP